MVRPRRKRWISFQPDVTYFKPAGVPLRELEEKVLSFDELEAIRLIDSEEMDQKKAAEKMKISQSTLSRLLKEARKKLSTAIVEGHSIKIHGGDFNMATPRGKGLGGRGRMQGIAAGPSGNCICPKCGHTEPHKTAVPCYSEKCPRCGESMTRE